MGTNECSQPASKSSWDSQDFSDVNMVLKMAHFHKLMKVNELMKGKGHQRDNFFLSMASCWRRLSRHPVDQPSVSMIVPWALMWVIEFLIVQRSR